MIYILNSSTRVSLRLTGILCGGQENVYRLQFNIWPIGNYVFIEFNGQIILMTKHPLANYLLGDSMPFLFGNILSNTKLASHAEALEKIIYFEYVLSILICLGPIKVLSESLESTHCCRSSISIKRFRCWINPKFAKSQGTQNVHHFSDILWKRF